MNSSIFKAHSQSQIIGESHGASLLSLRPPQMLRDFAKQHRLKIEKDHCGDDVIRSKYGHIYDYGASKLGVCILSGFGNAYRWNKTREAFISAGMTITQNGDHEGWASFFPEKESAAKVAISQTKIRPKRKVSQERREAMLADLSRAKPVRMSNYSPQKHWEEGVDIDLETQNRPCVEEMPIGVKNAPLSKKKAV